MDRGKITRRETTRCRRQIEYLPTGRSPFCFVHNPPVVCTLTRQRDPRRRCPGGMHEKASKKALALGVCRLDDQHSLRKGIRRNWQKDQPTQRVAAFLSIWRSMSFAVFTPNVATRETHWTFGPPIVLISQQPSRPMSQYFSCGPSVSTRNKTIVIPIASEKSNDIAVSASTSNETDSSLPSKPTFAWISEGGLPRNRLHSKFFVAPFLIPNLRCSSSTNNFHLGFVVLVEGLQATRNKFAHNNPQKIQIFISACFLS